MKTYDERMAAVQQKLQKKRSQRRVIAAIAGMLCLCIVGGIIFMPADKKSSDMEQYRGSEYYKVIQAVNRYMQNPPNYGGFLTSIDDEFMYGTTETPEGSGNLGTGQPGDTPNSSPNESVEITDHQVAGVHEGDLIKRSQTHIFYLHDRQLRIYPIAGDQTQLLTTWEIPKQDGVSYYEEQMYLSADATRLILVGGGYGMSFTSKQRESFVRVISLDVSDPTNVKEMGDIYLTGGILSSRMVGDQLMLFSRFRINHEVDFDNPFTYLPQIGTPENMQSIPAESIVIPEELTNRYYTVATLLNSTDLTIVDTAAFMSYSTELYVSAERIYALRADVEEKEIEKGVTSQISMTEVSCISYGEDGFANLGTFRVEGSVKNQYNMDEHDGVFRIVTAVTERIITESITTTITTHRNANLTCFKVGTWEQLAQVKNFAPEGETVESVRFDGNYAYVCTAVVITLKDPVFFFDMTDLNNIIVKDTGTIEGYSSSLVQLENGFLMGIGFDDARNLKVEIYEETTTGVQGVCEYILQGSFANDYKAYYIDRENSLFGIPTNQGYVLLLFDGYEIQELARIPYDGTWLNRTRGVVIDDYLYVFGKNLAVQVVR